jgi:hypothetical protein
MPLRLPRDTARDAIRSRHQALRKMGIEGRAALTFELGDHLRTLIEIGFRLHHPEWNEQQVQDATVEHLLGHELAEKVKEWARKKAALA